MAEQLPPAGAEATSRPAGGEVEVGPLAGTTALRPIVSALFAVGIVLGAGLLLAGHPIIAALPLASSAVFGWVAFNLRRPGADRLARWTIVVLVQCSVAAGAFVDGGVISPSNLWLALPPILAVVLFGRRVAIGSVVVSVLIVGAQMVAHSLGYELIQLVPVSESAVARWLSASVFVVVIAIFMIGYDDLRRKMERTLRERNTALEEAAERISSLQGLVTICMHCKNIRTGEADTSWERVESYMQRYGETSFSHGLCLNCMNEHYADG